MQQVILYSVKILIMCILGGITISLLYTYNKQFKKFIDTIL